MEKDEENHKWLQPKRDEEANHLVRYIRNQIEKQNTINIQKVSQHFCVNISRKMIFGARFFGEGMDDGGPGEEETQHVDALLTILEYHYAFSVSDYLPCLRWRFDFDGHEKFLRTSIETIRKYQDPLVDARIQMWKKNGAKMEKEDLFDVLIKPDNPQFTPQEIKAQIFVSLSLYSSQ